MTSCAVCDRTTEFRCAYCGKGHCGMHRLPENHGCTALKEHMEQVAKHGFLAGQIQPLPETDTVIMHEPEPFTELVKDVTKPKPSRPKRQEKPRPYPKFEKKKGWLQRTLEKILGDDQND